MTVDEHDNPAPVRRTGLHFLRVVPAEGDTAVAELMIGGEVWGDLRLAGIDLSAADEARLAKARFLLRLYAPASGHARSVYGQEWEFDCAEVDGLLGHAKNWLLEHEKARMPDPG